MKLFINYIRLPKLEINDYVFNRSSNNVWPTFKRDEEIKKQWIATFREQNQVVERYLQHLKDRKKGDTNFVIQIKNTISQKIKILKDPDFLQQSYLDEETQKRELESLKKGKDIYEKYKRFTGSWINTTKEEGFDADKTIQDLRQWNTDRPYPIAEINKLLDDWQTDQNKYNDEFYEIEELKTFEIQLQERTKDTITFIWRIPITIEKNKEGEEFKNRVFPSIPYYIFFFNGVYYEVLDWKQTGFETARVVAEESIFYNGYHWLLTGGVSGIIRNCPVGVSEEVCACFNTDFLNVRNKFYCNIKLVFSCYKISKKENKEKYAIHDEDGGFSIIACGAPIRIGEKSFFAKILEEYIYPPEVRERIRQTEEEHEEELRVERELSNLGGIWKRLKTFFVGEEGIIFLLFNRKLDLAEGNRSWFKSSYWREGSTTLPGETQQPLRFLRAGEHNREKQQTDLREPDYLEFLRNEKLLENEMYHPLMEHVWVTFMWRNKPVWAGTFREISYQLMVNESVSPAGNCYTVEANGQILFSITELVSVKIGGNDKTSSFWSTLITVGTAVASVFIPVAGAAGVAAKTAATAAGTLAGRGVGNAQGKLNHTETTVTMTIHEFRHKYMISGTFPLSMNLEWCNEAFNRYRSSRELLGVNTSTFVNNPEFGSYLVAPGFIRFSEIYSLGVIGGKREEWFRKKLSEGVFLNSKPYENYRKQLGGARITASQGGTIRKDWNEMVYSETFTIAVTEDHVSQRGGGMWIYKRSQLMIGSQGNKFSWIMDHLESNFGIINHSATNSDKWVVKHPGNSIDNYKLEIPPGWTDTEKNGMKTARVHYHLFSYGNGGNGESKNDPINEHWCTHFTINKQTMGNTTRITLTLCGVNITKNPTPGSENVPPSGSLPIDPLSSGGGIPEPLNIQGTLPPEDNVEAVVVPGGAAEPELEIETEIEEEKEFEQEEEKEDEEEKEQEEEKEDEVPYEEERQDEQEEEY